MRTGTDPFGTEGGRTARHVVLGVLLLVAIASAGLAVRAGATARDVDRARALDAATDVVALEADRAGRELRAVLDAAARGDAVDPRIAWTPVEATWRRPGPVAAPSEALVRARAAELEPGAREAALAAYRALAADPAPAVRVEALRALGRLLERAGDADGAFDARRRAAAVAGVPDELALLARFDATRDDAAARASLARDLETGAYPEVSPVTRKLLHERLGGDPERVRGLEALAKTLDEGPGAPRLVRVGADAVAWPLAAVGDTRRFAVARTAALVEALVPGAQQGACVLSSAGGQALPDPPFPGLRLSPSARALAEIRAEAAAEGVRVALPGLVLAGALLGTLLLLVRDDRRREGLRRRERAFLASVTHELKTPIANVRLYADTLAAHGASDPGRIPEFAAVIAAEADRLQARVEEMLDVAAGRRDLAPADGAFDVRAVVAACVAQARAGRPDRVVELEEPAGGAPLRARGSEDLVREAVDGLLDNALKFAPSGPVRVALAREGRTVVVRVRDEGPGIPAAERERVFEPFVRLDAAVSGSVPGTGLGLALARQCLAACGAQVRVEPVEGRGALLCVALVAVEPS